MSGNADVWQMAALALNTAFAETLMKVRLGPSLSVWKILPSLEEFVDAKQIVFQSRRG